MRQKGIQKICYLLLGVLGIFPLGAQEVRVRQRDVQMWLSTEVAHVLKKPYQLLITGEWRYREQASHLYFWYVQGQMVFPLNAWCRLAPGYRQTAFIEPETQRWHPLPNPLGDVIFHAEKRGWGMQDRHRIQYFFLPHAPNAWQYRNRFSLYAPYFGSRGCMRPFVSEEVFFFERRGFRENRALVGLELAFPRGCFSMSYMSRLRKAVQHWEQQHVLWFSCKTSF